MDGKDDIFGGSFGDQQEVPQKKSASFSQGAGDISTGLYQILKGLKLIFFKRIPMNLILLILIVGLIIGANYYWMPTPTAAVVYQNVTQECPICPECEECAICEECDECSLCEVCEDRIVYRYMCDDGTIATDREDCKPTKPEITTDDYNKVNGITLAINDIEYDDDDTIEKINYIIINEGSDSIKPYLAIKVYDRWTGDVIDSAPNKIIRINTALKPDDWIIRSDTVNMPYDEDERRIRIELKDALVSPPEYITAVALDFR